MTPLRGCSSRITCSLLSSSNTRDNSPLGRAGMLALKWWRTPDFLRGADGLDGKLWANCWRCWARSVRRRLTSCNKSSGLKPSKADMLACNFSLAAWRCWRTGRVRRVSTGKSSDLIASWALLLPLMSCIPNRRLQTSGDSFDASEQRVRRGRAVDRGDCAGDVGNWSNLLWLWLALRSFSLNSSSDAATSFIVLMDSMGCGGNEGTSTSNGI